MKRQMKIMGLLSGLMIALLSLYACTDEGEAVDGGDNDVIIKCMDDLECPTNYFCNIDGICEVKVITDDDDDVITDDDDDTSFPDDDDDDDNDSSKDNCPVMSISPLEVDFGAVQLNSFGDRSFTITNIHRHNPLLVYSIYYNAQLETDEFTIVSVTIGSTDHEFETIEFPIEIIPGDEVSVNLHYEPNDGGIDEGTIDIATDDPCQPLVQVKMVTREKGHKFACVCVVEEDENGNEISCEQSAFPLIEFGNVDLGATPQKRKFRVWNCGDEDGNAVLRIKRISFASGLSTNFWITEGNVTMLDDVQLSPLREQTVTVKFQPTSLARYPDAHIDRVMIETDSENITERLLEVEVQGTTNDELIQVQPNPIDFGLVRFVDQTECVEDEPCGETIPVSIYNYTGTDLRLLGFDLKELDSTTDNCDPYSIIFEPDPAVEYNFPWPGTNPVPVLITIVYNPVGPERRNDYCWLRFRTEPLDNPDNIQPSSWYFPIMGEQRAPNVPPTARISMQSHGQQVVVPIEGLKQSEELCFWGDTSTDADSGHQLKEFEWFIDTQPEGVDPFDIQAYYTSHMPSSCSAVQMPVNYCMNFPKSGEWRIGLRVMDCDGAWSNGTFVTVRVLADQGLKLVLTFEGGSGFIGKNLVDLDLYLDAPVGHCDDGRIDSFNTCNFPPPYGAVTMGATTQGVSCCGSREDMTYFNAYDGQFSFGVTMVEDCKDWYDFLIVPFCASRQDVSYTIEGYDPKDNSWPAVTLFTRTGKLTSAGDFDEFRIKREDGLWTEPIP